MIGFHRCVFSIPGPCRKVWYCLQNVAINMTVSRTAPTALHPLGIAGPSCCVDTRVDSEGHPHLKVGSVRPKMEN